MPSIFPNSEMASSNRRSYSKVKLFFQACSDLGLGGNEGEFGGEEIVKDFLTGLPGGFWTQFIVVMAVIFIFLFGFVCLNTIDVDTKKNPNTPLGRRGRGGHQARKIYPSVLPNHVCNPL